MASGNIVSILVQAIDSASNVFKAIGTSSEGMGSSVEKAMNSATKDAQKAQAALIGLKDSTVASIGSIKGLVADFGMIGIGASIVKQAKDWALAVYDLKRALGSTSEEASSLLAIGKYAGIGTQEAAGYFAKFGRAISQAKDEMQKAQQTGKTSNDIFTRLGFTFEQLQGQNSAQLFAQVADKMRNMADGADKDRVAMELFGRAGFQVTEMMNLSQEQIDAIIQKAKDMGLIVGDDVTEGWKNLDRAVGSITGVFSKLAVQIGNDLLPSLQEKVSTLKELSDTYANLSPQMRQVIGLTIEATGEFAVFQIGARTVAAFMPAFGAALLSPWTAVIGAIIIATAKLYEYIQMKDRVASYNPKAEVFEKEGQLYKKQWNDDAGVDELGNSSGGYVLVPLSDAEKEAHNYFKEHGTAPLWEQPPVPPVGGVNLAAPVVGGGRDKKDHSAEKLEEAQRRADNLMAELNQKIMEQQGSTFEIATAKLNTEKTKWQGEMKKMAEAGVDTTELGKKIEEYETIFTDKIKGKWRDAWTDVKNQTALIGAQITGDQAKQAEAEYQITLAKIKKERETREKELKVDKNDTEAIAAAKAEADEKILQAQLVRDNKIRQSSIDKYQQTLDYEGMTANLEGKTQGEIDQLRSQTLSNYIGYLDKELQNKQLTDAQIIDLEKKKNEAINQQHEIAGRNLQTVNAEAMRRIQAQTHDYAADMVDTFNEMNGQVTDHLTKILEGTESFSQGFKGIISDLVNDVIAMFTKMWVNQYVMGPLQQLFGNIIGAQSWSNSTAVNQWSSANGGAAPTFENGGLGLTGIGTGGSWLNPAHNARGGDFSGGWSVVGEEGPELAYFGSPAHIYDAQTSKAMVSSNSPPSIRVNITNNTNSEITADNTGVSMDADGYIIDVVLNAASTNKKGFNRNLKTALGVG